MSVQVVRVVFLDDCYYMVLHRRTSKQSRAVRRSVRARPQLGNTSSSHTRALRWIVFSRFCAALRAAMDARELQPLRDAIGEHAAAASNSPVLREARALRDRLSCQWGGRPPSRTGTS